MVGECGDEVSKLSSAGAGERHDRAFLLPAPSGKRPRAFIG